MSQVHPVENVMELRKFKVAELIRADYNPPRRAVASYCTDIIETAKTLGILTPITVTPDGVIIDGHRRVASAKYLGIKELYAVIDPRDAEEIYAAINSGRKPLTGNDKLSVYLKSPMAVDPKARVRLRSMERRIGRKGLMVIAKDGGSLATMNQAVQVCRYLNKDDSYLPRVAVWLAVKGMTYKVRRAMEDGTPPSVIISAINNNTPILNKWEASA